ncbi:hypothetical protein PV10_09174 [Exophiala mesophila]|uniref:HOOK N-terminal domain-containing protein n=1 Tax=Exophiala mesophila TaxID=212818 RepID=A0A0D1WGV3_EXOME|nr:uncharacterized protein PV10_09174 [Exophiala mesophila]KIV87995.1 hypothetical protein PV10_09174 [Exophiala mesophila]
MATEEAIAAGLIDWVNSLAVAPPVYTVEDLSNGHVVWKVLHQIDRFSFSGKLPEGPDTDQWINKWTNLKHIYDALSIFLLEDCGQRLQGHRPDLKAIAQSSSLPDTISLLKLLVVAAINCSERIDFLKQMQLLTESTQEVLMQTVQEAGDEDSQDESTPSDHDQQVQPGPDNLTSPRHSTDLDSVLASEERLARVVADNQRIAHEKRELQKQLEEFHLRYDKLQERFDQAQDEVKETSDRLAAVLAGRGDLTNRPLDTKHDTLIASLEHRAVEAESELEDLRKAAEVLRLKAEKAQKLQDDYDEIKIDRDRLARKANTAEKYRQKLEASQDLEKDNATLRNKINDLQTQLKQSDFARATSSDLEREVDEYRRLLPSIEQERHELNEMKKRLELDYHALEARYLDQAEQLSRQNQNVEDLQSRLRDYEDGIDPSDNDQRLPSPVHRDLERDEADFLESEARLTAALLDKDTLPIPLEPPLATTVSADADESAVPTLNLPAESDTISEEELKAIMSAMRSQAAAGSASDRESALSAQRKLVIAIERQRTKNKLLAEHIQKMNVMVQELQQQQNKPQDDSPPPPPPKDDPVPPTVQATNDPQSHYEVDDLTQQNQMLSRELRLMASAWFEQNQRLASMSSAGSSARGRGGVGFGNGTEPRGFLNRQRRKIELISLGR